MRSLLFPTAISLVVASALCAMPSLADSPDGTSAAATEAASEAASNVQSDASSAASASSTGLHEHARRVGADPHPGPLFERRKELWSRIRFAVSQGLDANAQLKGFHELEQAVQSGKEELTLEPRVEVLEKSIYKLIAAGPTEYTTEPDAVWARYTKDIMHSVRLKWRPPKIGKSGVAIIQYDVARDGSLGAMKVVESSGFPEFDEAAMQAVRSAAPFKGWPKDPPDNAVAVEQTFNYNVGQK